MDALYTQFTSNQNKGIVWKILCDNGTFNGIPDNKSSLVKMDFDRKISMIGSDIGDTDQLIQLNKRVIGEMVKNVGRYANVMEPNAMGANAMGANAIGENAMSANYNAADIAQQRQKVFENEFKQKQTEFEKFNSKPVPDKIDFADKADTPLGSEMDKILAQQIALREKQLNMVLETQDKTAASKWLQNGNTNKLVTDTIQLKIGEDIKIEPSVITPRKKVNFTEPNEVDFMSLLKKLPEKVTPLVSQHANAPEEFNIREILTEILNKQNKILDLLQNKIEKDFPDK